MNESTLAILGISAAAVSVVGFIPYLRDILKKKTKPERSTWWIWSALGFLAFSAQLADGATWSLGLTVGQLLTVTTIALLSLKYGYGKFHKWDFISLMIAALGIVLWLITDNPVLAIVIVIIVDIGGFSLTLRKTWYAPNSETLSAWILAAVSAVLGLLAVGKIDYSEIAYPLYITLGNWGIVGEIIYRRRIAKIIEGK